MSYRPKQGKFIKIGEDIIRLNENTPEIIQAIYITKRIQNGESNNIYNDIEKISHLIFGFSIFNYLKTNGYDFSHNIEALEISIGNIINCAFSAIFGVESNKETNVDDVNFDILHDYELIYSAFKEHYGIDLYSADLDFDVFLTLLGGLPPECNFSKIVAIRGMTNKDIKDTYGIKAVKIKTDWLKWKKENNKSDDKEKEVDLLSKNDDELSEQEKMLIALGVHKL